MSHELLLDTTTKISHQPYHDLQSFFCVLLWICVTMEGPGRHRLTNFAFAATQVGLWVASSDLHVCGVAKKLRMIDTDECARLVGEFHPYFDGLKPLADRLQELLFSYNQAKRSVTSRTTATHEEFIAAFHEERDDKDPVLGNVAHLSEQGKALVNQLPGDTMRIQTVIERTLTGRTRKTSLKNVERCKYRRPVLEECGYPLEDFATIHELLTVFIDTIQGTCLYLKLDSCVWLMCCIL